MDAATIQRRKGQMHSLAFGQAMAAAAEDYKRVRQGRGRGPSRGPSRPPAPAPLPSRATGARPNIARPPPPLPLCRR